MPFAKLDASMVFIGLVEENDPDDPEHYISVPAGCDLIANQAQWDPNLSTFHILAAPHVPEINDLSIETALRYIAMGFVAVSTGQPVPKETMGWAAAYLKSFDARSDVDQGA